MSPLAETGPWGDASRGVLCPPGFIRTVRGDIPADALGFCQAHEHLLIQAGPASQANPDLRMEEEDRTLAEVCDYRDAGGKALVDAQPVGSGRMAGGLVRVSTESGIHVVASTGFHRPLFYSPASWLFSASAQDLSALFVHELTVGMYEDGMNAWPIRPATGETGPPRAGLIKVAVGAEGVPSAGGDRARFLAAASAAAMTGAPVLVHTEQGAQGEALVRFFQSQGVSPEQLMVSHLDKVPDNGPAILSVLERGA